MANPACPVHKTSTGRWYVEVEWVEWVEFDMGEGKEGGGSLVGG